MLWGLLFVAGLLETGWAIGLKFAEGFTKPWASTLTIMAMVASMYLLAQCVRPGALPIGTAYAVWTGIGAVGTAVLGIIWFHEPASAARIFFIGVIVAGIIGLKTVTPDEQPSATQPSANAPRP